MQTWEFESFLKRISAYYDKKDGANKERNQLHFRKIQWIPGGPVLNDIFETITDEYEFFPRNLPKSIKKAWDLWKAENPEKITKMSEQQHTGCENCEKGEIWFTVYENNGEDRPTLTYRYSAPCGHCRRDFTSVPKLTVFDVKKRGGIIG